MEEKFGQFAPCFLTTTGISFCHIYFSFAKKQRALKLLSYLEKRNGGREKEKRKREEEEEEELEREREGGRGNQETGIRKSGNQETEERRLKDT